MGDEEKGKNDETKDTAANKDEDAPKEPGCCFHYG